MSTDAIHRTDVRFFAELAARWRIDAEFLSSPVEVAAHPAYREIVALGEPAVPLILAELEKEPDFWFAALREITGEDPVPPGAWGDVGAMAGAWLEWGRSHGIERGACPPRRPSRS